MKIYSCIYISGRDSWFSLASLPWIGWRDIELTLKCPNVTPHHLQHSPVASWPAACREVIAWSWRLLEHVLASPRACRQVGISSSERVNQNVDHTYVFLQAVRKRRPTGQRTDAGCKSACFTYINTARSVPHFTNPHIHLVSVCVCKCVLVMLRTGVKIDTFIDRKMYKMYTFIYTSQLFRSS